MGQFGKYLKLLLKKRSFSKAALARGLGLKRQNYINNIVAGLHTPTIDRVEEISRVLKCDPREEFELINLALEERKPRSKQKVLTRALYPELRKMLLQAYDKSIFPKDASIEVESTEGIKKELENYPFHPIERTLLKEILNHLVEKQIAPFEKDPIDYFETLSDEGKKKRIEQAGVCWTYNKKHYTLTFAFKDESYKLHYSWLFPEKTENPFIKEELLKFYSEKERDGFPFVAKESEIRRELERYDLHPIELQLLNALYEYLKIKDQKKNEPIKYFENLNKAALQKKFLEAKFEWAANKEFDLILIIFSINSGHVLEKKFKSSWTEIEK